ncbi:hypothetical protein Y032_0466g1970 [Ancylostoma ceylanicum]|uniref:Uncharacterized protein n=1 Tax=Ancylostoma ceylanicum TaxID=53326 RepID=A0A016WXG4_9BILA|nr:hypothetical protein Y032_0466g1970 [Ancylostoma ceylanicum]
MMPNKMFHLHSNTVGVNGDDKSVASRSTWRDRAAHGRIVAAEANLGFLDALCEAADGSSPMRSLYYATALRAEGKKNRAMRELMESR